MEPIKILVVDDEPDQEVLIAHKFKARIETGELVVLYAADGEAALQQLERHPDVAIALCDIRMPVMDGLTLLEHLRANYEEVCPVMISAYDDATNVTTAIDLGAYDFLTKPIDLRVLEFTLYKAIRFVRERSRREYESRAASHRHRLLADKCGDGLAVIQDDALVFVNQALCRLLGKAEEQLLKQLRTTVFGGTPVSRVPETAAAWQTRHLTRDEKDVWLELHEEPIDWVDGPAVLMTVHDVTARQQYEQRLEQAVQAGIGERSRFGDIIGASAAMQGVYKRIIQAASSDETVLISGESGTGKELIARTIHQRSNRHASPFVVVNCGAITATLFESELFGHVKGAFTDAKTAKAGFLAQAHQGTLFLDEVTELTPAQQVKLLRVLENHAYTSVGGDRPQQVDVRILAATNRNVFELVPESRMREDFLYRLYVIPLTVPPLRERKADLPLLIEHFLRTYSATAYGRAAFIDERCLYPLIFVSLARKCARTLQRAEPLHGHRRSGIFKSAWRCAFAVFGP